MQATNTKPKPKQQNRKRSTEPCIETVRLRKTLVQHICTIRLFLLKHGWIVDNSLKKCPEGVYDYWIMPQAMFDQLPKTKAPNVLVFASPTPYDNKPAQSYNVYVQTKIINIFANQLGLYTKGELEKAFLSPAKLDALLAKYPQNTK